ncbi:hypothetical protein DL98DRAFT_125894 [Cadophora sp. DSE1049]|nr:hypothetical protein DL98DRAFT_125894 [Cadophora sp. DSE1049]
MVDSSAGRFSVVDKAGPPAPLYGSLSWDNRRIKQRPNLLNSAAIAPESCVQLEIVLGRCLLAALLGFWFFVLRRVFPLTPAGNLS